MITRTDRTAKRAEYEASEWQAERLAGIDWLATCAATGASITFRVPWGNPNLAFATGASGNAYRLSNGACDCPDSQNRAVAENRPCRHAAALGALKRALLEEFRQKAEARRTAARLAVVEIEATAAARQAEARRSLAVTFGDEQGHQQRPLAA